MDGRYPPYPRYKPSGVDWLGEIPSHWDVRRLKFVASINPDTLPETTPKDYTFAYIDIGNVSSDGNISDPQEYTFETAPTRARRKVDTGDTIISTVRTYLQAITYIEDNLSNCIVSTGFAVLRPRESIHPRFLYYLVRSQGFVDAVMAHSNGVSYPAINPTTLAGLWGLLPPLPEQRAIAAYLDRETARIDALIARKRELLDLLERQRAALISHAVTRGLNPNVPLKPSGVDWLGEIPAHWDVRRLKSITAFSINGAWGDEPKGDENDLFCIRVADFDYENLGVSADNLTVRNIPAPMQAGRLLDTGDLLVEKSGGGDIWSVGRVVSYTLTEKAVSSNFIARLVVNRNVDERFVCYLFAAMYAGGLNVRSIKQTTGIQNLDLYSYLNERFGLPPLPEQRAIAAYLDRQTARIDRLKAEIESSIELLGRYRTALISAAVTGKIRVIEDVENVENVER